MPTDPANPPGPEQLRAFARCTLAGFKIPEHWYAVDELPLNSAGKLIRGELRASHEKRLLSE